ncbi:MAG: glycosyltransferase [Aeromicrobium sp.]
MADVSAKTVLHISEAFGGGIVAAVRAHVAATPEFRHVLAFSDRLEAPLTGHDLDPFDAVVTLPHEPLAAIRTIRRVAGKRRVDIAHAHSATGGGWARIALRSSDVPIIYTPHCFAYLRDDRSRATRSAYRSIEKMLSGNTSAYAACSPYELELCGNLASTVPRVYVPNALTAMDHPPTAPIDDDAPPHLLGVGRLLAQKDPEFFARAVEAVRAAGVDAKATWIGDGERPLRDRLVAAEIEVTGWLPRDESLRRLAQPGGVYLHSARWEGFPYAILEAHAAGLPLVIRDIPMLSDFAFPLMVRDPQDVAQAVKELQSPGVRADMVADAASVLAGNSPELQRERLLEVYRGVLRA